MSRKQAASKCQVTSEKAPLPRRRESRRTSGVVVVRLKVEGGWVGVSIRSVLEDRGSVDDADCQVSNLSAECFCCPEVLQHSSASFYFFLILFCSHVH